MGDLEDFAKGIRKKLVALLQRIFSHQADDANTGSESTGHG